MRLAELCPLSPLWRRSRAIYSLTDRVENDGRPGKREEVGGYGPIVCLLLSRRATEGPRASAKRFACERSAQCNMGRQKKKKDVAGKEVIVDFLLRWWREGGSQCEWGPAA